jgi:hypothetical protein
MAGGTYDLMHSGVSKYHHVGLIVPIIGAVTPFLVAPTVQKVIGKQHNVIMALVLGCIVTGLTYILLRYVPILKDDNYTLSKAVLLGLLSAELVIFAAPTKGDWDDRMISPPLLIFYLFMFLLGASEVETENTL